MDVNSSTNANRINISTIGDSKILLLIAFIGIVFLYPFWFHRGIVFSKHSDIIAEHLSIYAIGIKAVASEGCIPLWNPSMNSGLPAFANPESMYFFPFNLLFFIMPIDVATNLVILLNVILAGFSMYWFSRLFLDRSSAFFCAIAYMMSWHFLVMICSGWLPKMTMFALVPLLSWSCEKLIQRPTLRSAIWFSLVEALCFLQADMQQFYYAALGLAIYIMIRIIVSFKTDRVRILLCLIGGGLLGVMLAAPALLPRIEYASLSTRIGTDYQFFLARSPTFADLKTLIDPSTENGNRFEFWENNFYVGLWVFPLLYLALFHRKRRWHTALIFASALTMGFLCFDTPLLKFLFDYFPGFSLFRHSTRLLLLAQFILVFICGIGVKNLLSKDFFIKKRLRLLTIGLLCLFPILDSGLRLHPLLSVRPLSEVAPWHQIHQLLNRNEGRTVAVGRSSIPYGMAGYYGIDMINGYSPLSLKHYIEYFCVLQFGNNKLFPHQAVIWTDLIQLTRPDMLLALDVEYIVANRSFPFEKIGYRKITEYEQIPVFILYDGIMNFPISVWRAENPLGPAYFASSVTKVDSESESLDAIAAAKSILDAYVLNLNEEFSPLDYSGGIVKVVHRGFNKYEYEIDSRGENFLIISQIWYPGWRATLNDKVINLYRTNHALIGCFVPKGKFYLVLQMTSPMLKYGIIAACIALLVLAAVLIADIGKKDSAK